VHRSSLDYLLKIRFPVTIFVIIITFAITFYVSRPERDSIGYSPTQPINFSHRLHAGEMNIYCQYCHITAEKGRHATVPSTDICMNCHSQARKNKPEIIKLTQYFESGTPIPWVRIHKVPEYVYFNHSVHINKGIDCINCHGDVARMEHAEEVHSFTMGACLNCHRHVEDIVPALAGKIEHGPENCWACHR
jgi:hypothetical protein